MESCPEEWRYKIKSKHLENVFCMTFTYRIYGQWPYILEDYFNMMF